MTWQFDDALVNTIVAGVLDRLRGGSAPSSNTAGRRQPAEKAHAASSTAAVKPVTVADSVVTELLLETKLNGAKAVRFAPKAVLTPTARDFLRTHNIAWEVAAPSQSNAKATGTESWAALVVKTTPAVERVFADVLRNARTELLGCPDDAAGLAIAEIARGGFSQAIVFTEQSHRAACLANRHQSVKAVAVREVADVAQVRKQLRANVWCLDPTHLNYFELLNVLRAIRGH